jgi:hypothetical protein
MLNLHIRTKPAFLNDGPWPEMSRYRGRALRQSARHTVETMVHRKRRIRTYRLMILSLHSHGTREPKTSLQVMHSAMARRYPY